jgi:hypothetical protein
MPMKLTRFEETLKDDIDYYHFDYYHLFDTFPLLKSGLRPQFIIFNAGSKVCSLDDVDVALVALSPLLSGTLIIYDGYLQQC